ncbi:MAG: DUF222 domain-containing protein [Acidimicrobiales bacterium]
MSSTVMDPVLREAIDQVEAGLDAIFAAGLLPRDGRDAITVIRDLEAQGRRLAAAQVCLVDEIDQQRLYRPDGHASAKVMVRHVAHLSDGEAKRRASAAKALRDLPEVTARFRAGRIGSCQVQRIARAHANKRVRRALLRKDRTLAVLAERTSYRDFDAKVTEWVRRVDEDGTADRCQRAHENRDAKLLQDFDSSWNLDAGCGSVDGAQLYDIFGHFVDAETLADWEKARAEHGDAATVDDLPRTAGQRRFDALFAIFQQAASALAAGGGAQIVTNLVMDLATFERTVRRFAGDDDGPVDDTLDPDLDGLTPDDPDPQPSPGGPATSTATGRGGITGDGPRSGTGYRCSTLDGRPVDAREAVAVALIGQVRRVVMGADSVVIDQGRRRRLFTGSAQLAAKLSSMWCYWPGCGVPVTDCQVDHLIPWADHGGGSTSPANGGPACGRHNRLKEHGFGVRRDQAGHWHVNRPDGTEIH